MASLKYNYFPGIVLALLIILLTIAFILWRKHRVYRNVLLLGLTNSGKTALFTYMTFQSIIMTYTSIVPNSGNFKINNKSVRIIDIPGNEKVRQKYFDQFKNDTRGIIFVIDSITIQNDIKDVAELLYTILTDPQIKEHCTHLLLLCNKQNGTIAKGPSPIKFLLEKELDLLKSTKSKQLETIDESTHNSLLGSRKKPFEFSQCKPMNVEFAESIAYSEDQEEIEVQSVTQWLRKLK